MRRTAHFKQKKPHFREAFCFAPVGGVFSNQFWDELTSYATLKHLIHKLLEGESGLMGIFAAALIPALG
jgi:hypothetical protein